LGVDIQREEIGFNFIVLTYFRRKDKMSQYQASNELTLQRQLKVQKVSIPFVIVGNASSASVSVSCDEPAILFIRTQGVDQITSALDSGETANYSTSPVDSSGTFNILVKIREPVQKIVSLRCADVVTGVLYKLSEDAGGPIASNGSDMMLDCVASVSIATSNTLNGCVEVEYVTEPATSSGESY
jgi:hypothetical protein